MTAKQKNPILSVLICFLCMVFIISIRVENCSGQTEITANTNWSTISPAPTSTTDIIVKNSATLTVDISNADCRSVTLGHPSGGKGTLLFSDASLLTVSGLLTFASTTETQQLDMSAGGKLICQGFTGTSINFVPGTGTVELSANNTLPVSGITTFNHLIIGSGTTTLGRDLTVSGNLTINAGATLDVSSSNRSISLAGNWTNNGTFVPRKGTVSFTANIDVTQLISGITTFYDLAKPNSKSTLSFGNSTTTISKAMNIAAGSMNGETSTVIFTGIDCSLQGSAVKDFYNLVIEAGAVLTQTSSTNVNINNSYTNKGTFNAHASGSITFQTNNITLFGSGISNFSGLTISGLITVNANTHNFSVSNTINISAAGGTFNGGSSTVTFSGTTSFGTGNGKYEFNNVLISGTLSNATNSKNFSVKGNWTNNGTYTKGAETVTFNGGSAQSIGGTSSTAFNNLIFSEAGEKTIASGTAMECNSLNLTPGTTFSVASTGSTSSGSLKINGTKTINGTVKVQRFIPTDGWHIVSSPVSGQAMGPFSGNNLLGMWEGTYDLAPYNEAAGLWDPFNVGSGTTAPFEKAAGYLLRLPAGDGNRAVVFSGSDIFSGDVPKTLGPVQRNGWHAIGNPYLTPIKASAFLSENSAKLHPIYSGLYLWDNSTGDYSVLNSGTTDNIAMGQGFVVKRTDISPSSGVEVLFTPSMQTTTATFKSGDIDPAEIKLNVAVGELRNSTSVVFAKGMTNGLDPGYDVGKLKGNPDIALFTRLVSNSPEVDFAIQALPDMPFDSLTIPVGLDLAKGGSARFTIEKSTSFPANAEVVLEDAEKAKRILLSAEGTVYEATLPAMTGTGRFKLIVKNFAENRVNTQFFDGKLMSEFLVFVHHDKIYVNGPSDHKTRFLLFGMDGKLWHQKYAGSEMQNSLEASFLPAGIYMLRIENRGVSQTRKIIITRNQ